jgi:CRISPR-associated protein Cas1
MAFRTVIINTHCKLEYGLGYLIYKNSEGEKRVYIREINNLIVQSTAVSITTALLCELIKNKINVVFCDEKNDPCSNLIPFYGATDSGKKILFQCNLGQIIKDKIWKRIIVEKIKTESNFLRQKGKIEEANLVESYSNDVEEGDATNREGHSAKVYFNNIFFDGFTRELDCSINKYLNYGYTIILSDFNRAIVSLGYLTQIGIHHKSENNPFNLASDLMEPFRILIDKTAMKINEKDDFKDILSSLLSKEVMINGKSQSLNNAIDIYVMSVFRAMKSENIQDIIFLDSYDI